MRAESLSTYGHPVSRMPNFDKFAEEGVKFENCFTQSALCSPSRCSLMTGWYPHVMGHRTLWYLLRPHEPSMCRYLKEAGYRVEMYGKNDVFSKDYLPLALDKYSCQSKNVINKSATPYYSDFLREPLNIDLHETRDMKNVQEGIDFINSHKRNDKPFMLFLSLTNPHPPYMVPQPFYDMYNPDEIPSLRPVSEGNVSDFQNIVRKYHSIDKMPESFFRKINAVYLGMCSYADWMFGKLLTAIDNSKFKNDTTVIISSDHGGMAGDYGLVNKIHNAHYDILTRVSLIIRTPGAAEGKVVKEQVELFDVMPTILELANVEVKHTHFAHSLVPQLNGADGDPERAVFTENGYNIFEPHCFVGYGHAHPGKNLTPQARQQQEIPESMCRTTTIRTMNAKLIRRPDGLNELYDLREDPKEIKNVYSEPEYEKVRSRLNNRLLEWYIKTSDVVPFNRDNRKVPDKDSNT